MEENSKAKIVGFITIMLIIILLILFAFLLVHKNQQKQIKNAENVVYKKNEITMNLNSHYIEYVNLGDIYNEKGVTAYIDNKNVSDDIIISYYKNEKQISSIDTNTLGNYLVKYILNDNKKVKVIYKTIIVIDKKPPLIKLEKTTTISLNEVDIFDPMENVSVIDNSGKATLTYEGAVEKKVGSYIITYKAIDKSGNKSTKKRLVKVN